MATEEPSYLDFYNAAADVIEGAGVKLSDSAAQFFMTHAKQLPYKIASGQMPDGTDPMENFRVLAHEVVNVQSVRATDRAGSDVVDAALRRLCPLFPFC